MSRGDARTIEKHLHAMEEGPESRLRIYKMMGLEALKLARAKGKMAQGSEEMIQNLLVNDA
jgi:phosphoribosylformylglycinamidine (FGAM) synthase PurS component